MLNISSTLESKNKKLEFIKNNITFYDGGLGENPLPAPNILINTVIKYSHRKEYTSATGISELKNILGNKLIVGNGLKPLLFLSQLAFNKLYPNGKIYHIIPYWVSYKEQTNILNIKTQDIIPEDKINWKICSKDIQSKLNKNEQNFIIFNNPSNPTGCIYTDKEIKELAKIFKEYNCIVLLDNIYENIIHTNKENFGKLEDYYDNIIIGSSLSKMVACGGYRFGWLRFKSDKLNELYDLCNILASSIYSCPSIMFQYVAIEALTNPLLFKYYKFQNNLFCEISNYIKSQLNKTKIIFSESNSAWYILLNFDNYKTNLKKINILTNDDLNKYLINNFKIITVSGCNFGIKNNLILRFSYIDIKDINIDYNQYNYDKIKKCFNILINWINNI